MKKIAGTISDKLKNKWWMVVLAFIFLAAVMMDRIVFVGLRDKMAELDLKIAKEETIYTNMAGLDYRKEILKKEYEQCRPYFLVEDSYKEVMTIFLKEMENNSLIFCKEYEKASF